MDRAIWDNYKGTSIDKTLKHHNLYKENTLKLKKIREEWNDF